MASRTAPRRAAAAAADASIAELQLELAYNVFDNDETMHQIDGKTAGAKRSKEKKPLSKYELSLDKAAADRCLAFTTAPPASRPNPSEMPKWNAMPWKAQTDENFDKLSPKWKKAVGNPESYKYEIYDMERSDWLLCVIEGVRGLQTFIGGDCRTFHGIETSRVVRNNMVRVVRSYASNAALEKMKAKVTDEGRERLRGLKAERESKCTKNSEGKVTGGNGRKGNADGDYFIGYGVTESGEKDANLVLRKQYGMANAAEPMTNGGFGGDKAKIAKDWEEDPNSPGVYYKRWNHIFHLEKHTTAKPAAYDSSIADEAELKKRVKTQWDELKAMKAHWNAIKAWRLAYENL